MSSFVLRAMMSGQYWPEGDEVYHAELTVPVLLVHGMHDKFVPVEEDQRMAEVWHPSHHTPQIPPAQPRGTLLCAPAPGTSELRLRVKGGVQKVGLPGTGVWIMCCPLCPLKGTLRQTSLAVQWLALHTSTAGGMGSILRWGTRIPHAMWRGPPKKRHSSQLAFVMGNIILQESEWESLDQIPQKGS